MLEEGVEVGVFNLNVSGGSEADSLNEYQRNDQHAFVTLETEVLLHHVSETLLRLYLAHEHAPPCPWISTSRERRPRRVKNKVSGLLDRLQTSEGEDKLARVLIGSDDRTFFDDPGFSAEEWKELVDSTWTRGAARTDGHPGPDPAPRPPGGALSVDGGMAQV